MTKHVMSVALLSTALTTGCGGSSTETPQNTGDTGRTGRPPRSRPPTEAPPPAAPAPGPRLRRHVDLRLGHRLRRARAGRSASALASNVAPARPAAPAEPPKPVYRDVSAAVGTALSLSLITPLSTETAKVETPVTARLRQPIVVDGFTVVPAGATLHGDVTDVERAGRVKGRSRLVIRFTEVQVERSARSVPDQCTHLRG